MGGSDQVEIWTIECNAYLGPGRAQMADDMASALKRLDRLRPEEVWVEHEADRSRVFYGNYKLRYVRARVDSESHAKGDLTIQLSDAIKRDLKFIRGLAVGDQYPFFSARPIPKPTADVGPPEWDLNHAQGVYTLHVGVTYNTPTLHNYKQAAVEWVKALREDGYEAYYYHDADKPQSSICVGTFGEDAWIEVGKGKHRYSDAVEALRRQADFQWNLENGHKVFTSTVTEDGTRVRVANPSFLVKIPRHDQSDAR